MMREAKIKFIYLSAENSLILSDSGKAQITRIPANVAKIMKKIIPILICLSCLGGTLRAQTAPEKEQPGDSVKKNGFFRRIYRYFEGANEDKTLTKKIDFSVIGGPHYSSDSKLGLGLVAAGLYRIDRNDLSIPPSNVSLFGDITTTGFYLLGVRGNNLFQGAKYRIDYTAYFFSFPGAFWGIGYENGAHAESASYKRLQNQVKADFLYRVGANMYLGGGASFNFIWGKDLSKPEYLNGQASKYINTGLGISFIYDSRDVITNAHRGAYAKIEQRFFPGFLGNKGAFYKTELFGDIYHEVWKGGVLAYDLHMEFNAGKVPWTMLALLGGSYRMRGYYEGQYRDKNMIETQLELRQKIYNRHGVAFWVGAGNVFPSFGGFRFRHTLPNYGLGYRWEFKNRVNVRLDYGFGKGQNAFIFNINEAF